MANFIVGDRARISVEVRNVAGALADPTTLSLTIKPPGGFLETHVEDVSKSAVGQYYFDLALTLPGTYSYRWQSLGQNQAAIEGGLYVYPQTVV